MSSDDELGAAGDGWGPRGKDKARERRRTGASLFQIVLAAALVFAIAFAAAPWFAFRALRSAAQNQDIQALGELVDYDAVRVAMRAQIRPTEAAQTPPPNVWQDPLGAVRRALQQPIQRPPEVDAYLTPAALARMADGLPPRGEAVEAAPHPFPKVIYWGIDRCRIAVEAPGDPGRRTVFTFARTDLFDWKLVQIRLPRSPDAAPGQAPAA